MLTPYVTIAGRTIFERNKTGFGYMVMDIAKAVGKLEEVNVLATDTRSDAFVEKNVLFIQRSLVLFLAKLFYCISPRVVFRLQKKYRMRGGSILRLWYYWLMTGYLKSVLNENSYDIVHIHGCGFATDLWMSVCENCEQKFIVTLHGLNSFSETVRLESAGKKYERDFLKKVANGKIPITVISTGMKKIIENTYETESCNNITVVCNSFNFEDISYKDQKDIRNIYKLPGDCKLIVCVGNVCIRKNQGQLIRAFEYLPEKLADLTYILFLGGIIQQDYTIELLSAENKWKSHFVVCGVVPKEEVHYYYNQCDGVALMSLSEGFGLSLIEGMHFGKPCISFTDVDAFEDIYHPDVMVGVEGHDDEAVARGVEDLLLRQWDKNRIYNYSRKFESDSMARNYINAYKTIIG